MEALWEIKKEVITPEEVVARINKLVEAWAEEEKAEALQRTQRKEHHDKKRQNTYLFNVEDDNLKELID